MFSPAFSASSSSLPAFFVLFCFVFSFFSPPSFRVFYNLLTFLRGCFNRRNIIFLSCSPLHFFPFSPLFSPLFSFFPPFSSFPFPLPADFWCGDRRHAAPLPTGLDTMKHFEQQTSSTLCSVLYLVHPKPSSIFQSCDRLKSDTSAAQKKKKS